MGILDKITSLAKRRGFIYPGSEIYGGMRGTWDYGPLGAELKRNIKQEFWKTMVQGRNDVVGIDTAILMNPKVWEASGHVESFSDPLVECKKCKKLLKAKNFYWGKRFVKRLNKIIFQRRHYCKLCQKNSVKNKNIGTNFIYYSSRNSSKNFPFCF